MSRGPDGSPPRRGLPGRRVLRHWVVRRLALAVVVVLGAATAAFAGLWLAPGDPVQLIVGSHEVTPETAARVRADLGLDEPLIVQYGRFLLRLLQGDLGQSYQLSQPVSELLGGQAGATVALALTGFLLAALGSVLLAVATAGRRPLLRRASSAVELVLSSTPAFWAGIVLLTLFSFQWQLFPAVDGGGLDGLVLPGVTLALPMLGVFTQVLRESMERSLEEPYALSARARGSGETALRLRHSLRHTLVPLLTLSGWTVGSLLSGAVVVETVFSRQGIGRIAASAISTRDLPVVTGVVVVSAVVFTLVNLLVDVLYAVADPRLKEASG
ncbi:ABC transporter permease [Kitasatospora sp. NPDC048239]|uniref:ABC transporter permease n=1 Tax=Kitasatospora sp. NPDC048239 TaxID=3364046 RepID=UPI003721EE2F